MKSGPNRALLAVRESDTDCEHRAAFINRRLVFPWSNTVPTQIWFKRAAARRGPSLMLPLRAAIASFGRPKEIKLAPLAQWALARFGLIVRARAASAKPP